MDTDSNMGSFFKICLRGFIANLGIILYKLFRYASISLFLFSVFIVLLYGIYLSVGAAISENNGIISAFDFISLNINSVSKSHFFNDFINLIEICIYTFAFSLFLNLPFNFKSTLFMRHSRYEDMNLKKSIDLTDIDPNEILIRNNNSSN